MFLIYLAVFWLFGLWLASVTDFPLEVWLGLGVGALVVGILLRKHGWLGIGLICVGALGLAGVRYQTAVPMINESHIAFYNDSLDVTISGLIVDEPNVQDRFTDVRVAVDEVVLRDGTAVPVTGLVQMRTFRYPELNYGMRVEANGRLEIPPEFEDFSYKAYLARQNVHSLMSLPFVDVLGEGEGNPIYHVIYAVKFRAQTTIERLLPSPQSALLTGILLGNDNGIPPDLAEDFRITGMTHIIAISG